MATKEPSALDVANDLLAPLVPRLLAAFAAYRGAKKAPTSMRTLQPLALVFMLEAFGLAFLLTDEQRSAAWTAARGPGRKGADDYDPTDDTEEAKALRWAAARQRALDKAYHDHARSVADRRGILPEHLKPHERRARLADFMSSAAAPNRTTFERQWGERNPIDPTTCPAAFDPRAQLSILDAVSPERDGIAGVFVAETRLRAEAPPIISHAGHELDLSGCQTLAEAAWRAITDRWLVYLDHRGATVGLRLLPPTEGTRVRLRAPLVNVIMPDVELLPSKPVAAEPRGAFVSLVRLKTGTVEVECDGHRLDLHGARSITTAVSHAVRYGWSATPAKATDGLPGIVFAPTEHVGHTDDYATPDLPPPSVEPVDIVAAMSHAMPISDMPGGPFKDLLRENCLAAYDTTAEPAPVCPRCLGVEPGKPCGDPSDPHPGPFTPDLCDACSRAVADATEGQRAFQEKSRNGLAIHSTDDEPAQPKRGKAKPSGAESKISKRGKRAAS